MTAPRGQVTFGVLVTAREILYLATTVRPPARPPAPALLTAAPACSRTRLHLRSALFQQSGFELGLAKSE